VVRHITQKEIEHLVETNPIVYRTKFGTMSFYEYVDLYRETEKALLMLKTPETLETETWTPN
jgi:hypothetical protein